MLRLADVSISKRRSADAFGSSLSASATIWAAVRNFRGFEPRKTGVFSVDPASTWSG